MGKPANQRSVQAELLSSFQNLFITLLVGGSSGTRSSTGALQFRLNSNSRQVAGSRNWSTAVFWPSVLVRATIAMMIHYDPERAGKKRVDLAYTATLHTTEGSQSRNASTAGGTQAGGCFSHGRVLLTALFVIL